MILRGLPKLPGSFSGFGATIWICALLVITTTNTLAQDGRFQTQNSQVRRGQVQNIIRTRVSSGIPLRRVTTPFYEPIYAASEVLESGYGYPEPSKLSKRPPIGETSTNQNNIELERITEPAPVRPSKSFVQTPRQPTSSESEQSIDSEGIFPAGKSDSSTRASQQTVQSQRQSQGHDDGNGGVWPDGYKGVIPGVEGVDYPIYSSIPETSFSCGSHKYSGYYADEEARCQVFHVCLRRLRRRSIEKWSFLCPNGTIFSQKDFVCVWWNNAPDCDASTLSELYELNANLGWDNHADSATQSIRNMMATMIPAAGAMVAAVATPVPQTTFSQSNSPFRSEQSQNQQQSRGQRIPVSLSASTNGGQKRVNIETTVPVTQFTGDGSIQASLPDREYETNVDSQLIDTRTTSQQESQTKTKSGSALHMSQSEAYEEFGESDALEKPGPFIVNREPKVVAKITEEPMDSGDLEDRDQTSSRESDGRPVPTLVMVPVQQDFSDGSTRVIEMPVMIMMKESQRPVGFPPAAVTNPKGMTIPNLPQSPPRTYLPPRRETTTQAEALTSGTQSPTTNLPPREEQEFGNNVDYSENDREPPGTQPIIDYELSNSEAPQPVTPPVTTTSRPSNAYLPPRAQTIPVPPTTTTLPDIPSQTEQTQTEEPTTTTLAPLKQSQIESATVPASPSGAYLPPKSSQASRPNLSGQGTFVAMDGALVNQILQSAGIMDLIDDGKEIRGFQPATEGNDEKVQYPTPESSQVNQGNRQDVGTASQLFNGQVRTVYSKKQIQSSSVTTPLPTFDTDKNKELLQKIQYGGYDEGSGNKLADGLEKITPGYIDLPARPNPTQISPSELPGTESVRAFLTSQKEVDPKQTLEIFQFDKYALFVPEAAQREKNGLNLNYGTPAPSGLVQGPTVLPTTVESLFGPLARDVIPQQHRQQSAGQNQNSGYSNNNNQQQQSGGYSDSKENNKQQQSNGNGLTGYSYNQQNAQSQPIQPPSGLYGLPSKEFRPSPVDKQRQSQPSPIITDVTVETTVQRETTPVRAQKAQKATQTKVQNPEQRLRELLNSGSGNSNGNGYSDNNQVRQPQSQAPQKQAALPQAGTFRFPQIQLQLPVLVESHSSHLVPFPSPQPQFFLPQQPQQQQREAPPNFVPNVPRPSGLYQPPFLNAPLGYIQPQTQSSVLSNTVHVPLPTQVTLPLGRLRNSNHEAEVIQAIPVHSSTIVETRPLQRGNNIQPSGYPSAQVSGYQTLPQLAQVQPQYQQFNDLNAYHHHQQQINRVQLQHQQPRALTHSIPFQPLLQQQPQQQLAQYLAPVLQQHPQHQVQQVSQFQPPSPQQIQSQFQPPSPQQIQSQFRPIVQPVQQPRTAGYAGGSHYVGNSHQAQAGNSHQAQAAVGGYRSNEVVGRQQLNMFTSHEATTPSSHQQHHQQSHQQNVHQFIQQQRDRVTGSHNQLAHGSNALASSAQRTLAVPQPAHQGSQQQQHQQQQQHSNRPSGSYGTGTGSQLEMAGEQVSYNNYEVFYPGQDKSLGVKLTYQFTD